MKLILTFILLNIATSCYANEVLTHQQFNFKALEIDSNSIKFTLWSTNYYLPEIEDGTGSIPMRNIDGKELGPLISLDHWCSSALEGTVRVIFKDGKKQVYNYYDSSDEYPVDCSSIYSIDLSRTKFQPTRSIFGLGINNYLLVPYRSIATDPMLIPTGSVIYIPKARGTEIRLSNGKSIIHDGYFLAADRGGAIKENHIDVFTGITIRPKFFSWIGSMSEKVFDAYLVKNEEIIQSLVVEHNTWPAKALK